MRKPRRLAGLVAAAAVVAAAALIPAGCSSSWEPTGEPYFAPWFIPGTEDAAKWDFLLYDLAETKYATAQEYYGTTLEESDAGEDVPAAADRRRPPGGDQPVPPSPPRH